VQRKMKASIWLILGLLAAGLVAQPEFARSKTAAEIGKQKLTTAHTRSLATKPDPQPEVGKVILVLQTRDHRVTVRSSGGKDLRYSVASLHGIALADGLSVTDLKNRFPELHDIVTGPTAWAGE